MKKLSKDNCRSLMCSAGVRPRTNYSGSKLSALVLAGGVLLSLDAHSQFPSSPSYDNTQSAAVFRIVVDPAFYFLMQGSASPVLAAYPGFNDPAFPPVPALSAPPYTLTSPFLYDGSTQIGLSVGYAHPLVGTTQVGMPPYPPTTTLRGYNDFSCPPPAGGVIPFLFIIDPPPPPAGDENREVLTEMYDLNLTATTNCVLTDPRLPILMVRPGPSVQAGVGQGLGMPSLGMIQSLTPQVIGGPYTADFPARSFFNIYAEVTLTPVPTTESFTAFPTSGAVLYNDCTDPMYMYNPSLAGLPPTSIYSKTVSLPAVPLRFKTANPPYWNQDDVFGYMVLGGHGLFLNDCGQAVGTGPKTTPLLDAAFGPIGTSAKQGPIPFLYPQSTFPTTGSTYDSVQNIDILSFTVPAVGTVYARNFSHSQLAGPIGLPPVSGSAVYTEASSMVNFEVSLDKTNWYPESGAGMFQVAVYNTNGPSGVYSNYTLVVQQMSFSCSGLFPLQLRSSLTLPSQGLHFVRTNPHGFNIASEIDTYYEITTDGTTWIPGDRSLRIQVATANCGTSAQLSVALSGTSAVVLSWSDSSYRLQGSPSINPSAWVDIPGKSPVTNNLSGPYNFYRLRCP
jgi:hypothetical protein